MRHLVIVSVSSDIVFFVRCDTWNLRVLLLGTWEKWSLRQALCTSTSDVWRHWRPNPRCGSRERGDSWSRDVVWASTEIYVDVGTGPRSQNIWHWYLWSSPDQRAAGWDDLMSKVGSIYRQWWDYVRSSLTVLSVVLERTNPGPVFEIHLGHGRQVLWTWCTIRFLSSAVNRCTSRPPEKRYWYSFIWIRRGQS